MKKNEATRFCIIGAGAAGLTAAETLKSKGYKNITILEKESFAGGKCRSFEYEGLIYELGAGIIAGNNQTIIRLAKKANIPLNKAVFEDEDLFDAETGGLLPDLLSFPEKVSFFWQLLLKYRRLCHKYQSITAPGFASVDPSLSVNFAEWAKIHEIPLIPKNFERYFTGFGYGYWEEIPAAYVLKYTDWETVKSFVRGEFYTFPTSVQSLWTAIAAYHDVHYNTTVKSIRRDHLIAIKTESGLQEFDVLLLSSPLDEALHFLDASAQENLLFSKIIYNDYQCHAAVVKGFPQQTGYLPAHFDPEKKGQPLFWYKRFTESEVYTFYVLGDWKTPDSQIQKNISAVVKKFGGEIEKFLTITKWKYFPHISKDDMENGFYQKLEKLQGKNNTYYIGELSAFATLELTAAYARHLIEKYF